MTQRHAMFAAFANVHAQFQQARQRYSAQENAILKALQALEEIEGKHSSWTPADLAAQHPVMRYLKEWQYESERVRQEWQQRVRAYHTVNAFRDKVGDSFLVYVYGKVNAGKSSLGNFVATGHACPGPVGFLQNDGVRFGWQASSRGSERVSALESGFGVKSTECTSAVQFFTLPGLTWVDSPGLHSSTPENGELARHYVEASDMVVYVMNARNPGRQSDGEELRYLMTLKKPLYIVLSRSDQTEENESDHGEIVTEIVMKPRAQQIKQEQYVRQQLEEIAAEIGMPEAAAQCQIMSLSVSYAEHTDSKAAWEASGMGHFMSAMTQLAQGDSVRYKQQVPLERLRAFSTDLHYAAQRLDHSQQALANALDHLAQEVTQTADRLLRRLEMRAIEITSALPDSAFEEEPNLLIERVASSLRPEIQRALAQSMKEQLKTFERSATKAMDFSDASGLPGFKQRYESIDLPGKSYSNQLNTLGKALGSGIGYMVGGTKGASIGATIGAQLGDALGEMFSVDSTTLQVYTGNNRRDLESALVEKFRCDIERHIQEVYTTPVISAVASIQQPLKASHHALCNLQHQLGRVEVQEE